MTSSQPQDENETTTGTEDVEGHLALRGPGGTEARRKDGTRAPSTDGGEDVAGHSAVEGEDNPRYLRF
ncbi:hypothetical protein [Phycicoccus flavus]|uniref:Uncharacterized protein n=1 Tax=Phycicoccus flavus TaxID=2502783 RepID=A0A8T6R5R2_9MICO|nr:hypothetical protein [Phycicoccus flavus]NHA67561.1 hypothetical protein [Phycicoccus flavus]